MTTIENATESFRSSEEFVPNNNPTEDAVNTTATEIFKKLSENVQSVHEPLKPHGELWECVETLPQEKGNILKFKLRKQFDSYSYPKKLKQRIKPLTIAIGRSFPQLNRQ